MRSKFDNVAKNYLYVFLSSFSISEAVWVLFLAYRGMSLIEIGLLESIFHVTSMLMELPTGIIADRFGRKLSRVLSRAMALIASLLMILSHGFWGFAIAFALSALSYNLESGAGDALIYDSLVDAGKEMTFMRVKGRIEIAYQSARSLALVAGGFLATVSYELAYLLTVIIHGISFATALTFEEPHAGRPARTDGEQPGSTMVRHCSDSIRVIRKNKAIVLYILFIEAFSLFYTTLYFYFQSFLKSQGYGEGSIGLILAGSATTSVLSATQIHRIDRKVGRKVLITFAPLIAMGCFGLIAFTKLEPMAMILLAMVDGLLFVSFSDYINRLIPSENRATILSFQAMTFSIMMACFFPLIGALSESRGFKTAFITIFCLSIIVLLGMRWKLLNSIREAV